MPVTEAEKLAKKIFGAKIIKAISGIDNALKKRYKVVVFVPLEKTDVLTFAMASMGAGSIGNYSVCSFRMKGVGTFMGNEGTEPSIGKKGNFEMTEEVRLEMICDKRNLPGIIKRMYEIHPYDEPAFEVYEVLTGTGKTKKDLLIIPLKKKIPVKTLLKKINPSIKYVNIRDKIKNTFIKECIIDSRTGKEIEPETLPEKILYIKKSKNNIKAYLT